MTDDPIYKSPPDWPGYRRKAKVRFRIGAEGSRDYDDAPIFKHDYPNALTSLVAEAEDADLVEGPDGSGPPLVPANAPQTLHMPLLDVDQVRWAVVQSTTPGNWHVYIDKAIPWAKYVAILRALIDADLVDRQWGEASIRQGAATLRLYPKGQRES